DLVVANSQAVADCTLTNERLRPTKLATVYNGLPPSAFDEAVPVRLGADLPTVLCVAKLRWCKGQGGLVRAAGVVRGRGRPCPVVPVGEGPERPTLERLAAELSVDVRLLGARQDVQQLLAGADVVVLPSLTEGMPNAVMEAMAAGRPVVATAVG